MPATRTRRRINEIARCLQSSERDVVFRGLDELCLIMTSNPHCLRRLPRLGALPKLMQLLQMSERPDLQLRSAAILVYLAASTDQLSDQRPVVDEACRILIDLLRVSHTHMDVRCFACCTLLRALQEGPDIREVLISQSIIPTLSQVSRDIFSGFENNLMVPIGRLAALLCKNPEPMSPDEETVCRVTLRMLLSLGSTEMAVSLCSWIVELCPPEDALWVRRMNDSNVLDCLTYIVAHNLNENYVLSALNSLERVSRHFSLVLLEKGLLWSFNHMLVNLAKSGMVHMLWSNVMLMLLNVASPPEADQTTVQRLIDAGMLAYIAHFINHGKRCLVFHGVKLIHLIVTVSTRDQLVEIFRAGLVSPLVNVLVYSWGTHLGEVTVTTIHTVMIMSEVLHLDQVLYEGLIQLDIRERLERLVEDDKLVEIYDWLSKYES